MHILKNQNTICQTENNKSGENFSGQDRVEAVTKQMWCILRSSSVGKKISLWFSNTASPVLVDLYRQFVQTCVRYLRTTAVCFRIRVDLSLPNRSSLANKERYRNPKTERIVANDRVWVKKIRPRIRPLLHTQMNQAWVNLVGLYARARVQAGL